LTAPTTPHKFRPDQAVWFDDCVYVTNAKHPKLGDDATKR